MMRLLDYIEASLAANSAELFDLMKAFTESRDLPYFAHAITSEMLIGTTDNAPSDWMENYFGNQHYLNDPVIDASLKVSSPFSWDNPAFVHSLKNRQLVFMQEAASYGLASGLTVPLPSFGSGRGLVSFATDSRRTFNPNDFRELQIAALHFHMRKIQTAQFPIPKLSQRQLECLKWAADGKTTWETSCILNISEATVREHLIRASHVLGTTNKIAAVARAVHLGLVVPS